MSNDKKPRIAVTLGDTAGIGAELIAKLTADKSVFSQARIILIGDARQWEAGVSTAKVNPPRPKIISAPEQIKETDEDFLLLDFPTLDPKTVKTGEVDLRSGKAVLDTLLFTFKVIKDGLVDGYLFAPLNKEAMHKGGSPLRQRAGAF